MEFIASLSRAEAHSGLTPENLQNLERVFKEAVGSRNELELQQFKKIIQSKNMFFAERMFKLFDIDNSGAISLSEFISSMRKFATQTPEEKLRILFSIYDIDGDGLIQPNELKDVIRGCMEENNLNFTDDQIDELTLALFEDADVDKTGSITFEELKDQLEKNPGLKENLSLCIERWLMPPDAPHRPSIGGFTWPKKLTRGYVRNNYVSVGFFLAFLTLNVAIFVSRMVEESIKHSFLEKMQEELMARRRNREDMILQGVNFSMDLDERIVDDGEVEARDAAMTMGLHSVYELVARGFGQCLNFTCTFVVLPMLRMCITWLRSHGFSRYLPLDQHIYYHKLTGFFILFYSLGHTISHIMNFVRLSQGDSWTVMLYLFTSHYDIGWVAGSACITGWILLLVLLVMVFCSLPFVRRNGRFEVFYYTHSLYTVFWIALILHGPNFWKWFLIPGLVFTVEMMVKVCRYLSSYGTTSVLKGVILPSKVIHLVIKRPPDFDFMPGDYVYVNIPKIARFEWHPFTISSAPEKDDVLWLHIRAVGEWTNYLYQYFDDFRKQVPEVTTIARPQLSTDKGHEMELTAVETIDSNAPRKLEKSKSLALRARFSGNMLGSRGFRVRHSIVLMPQVSLRSSADCTEEIGEIETLIEEGELGDPGVANFTKVIVAKHPLQVRIDGPYGSPSSHIFRAQHAVLISTGIGVTPFASILQSIMYRYYQARSTCPKCTHCWIEEIPQSIMKLRKVDFFWINRNQQSLEWFVKLLSNLEVEQAVFGGVLERFLDVHIYITSALDKTDMRAVGLQMALDLLHKKEKRCLITGLKTRTQPGRPDWDKVFTKIACEKKGKVTVFYCGPPQLSRILHDKCNDYSFMFRKENF